MLLLISTEIGRNFTCTGRSKENDFHGLLCNYKIGILKCTCTRSLASLLPRSQLSVFTEKKTFSLAVDRDVIRETKTIENKVFHCEKSPRSSDSSTLALRSRQKLNALSFTTDRHVVIIINKYNNGNSSLVRVKILCSDVTSQRGSRQGI